MVDFIAEFSPNQSELDEVDKVRKWIVNVDDSFTLYVGGIGIILKSPEGDKLKYLARLQYQTTNNKAEYEALLKGLELAKSLGVESVVVHGDSQLIINQVNGMCEAKEGWMKKYLNRVRQFVMKFKEVSFVQLPREENMEADALAKVALAGEARDEFDKIQYMPSIDLLEAQQIEERVNWMTPIVIYLKDERLPDDKDETKKLRIKVAKYVLIDKVVYKRGFFQPYLRCLALDESNYVLREVHEGACGNHLIGKSTSP